MKYITTYLAIIACLLTTPAFSQTNLGSLEQESSVQVTDMGSLDDDLQLVSAETNLTYMGSLDTLAMYSVTDLDGLHTPLGGLKTELDGLDVPQLLDTETCKKITVHFYSYSGCDICDDAQAALESVPWIELVKHDPAPKWVDKFPTIHWKTENGKWKIREGWNDQMLSTLTADWQKDKPTEVEVIQKEVLSSAGYRTRGGWWSVSGDWNPSRQKVVNHLLNSSKHKNKFSKSYLDTLTYAELQSLHSDDHEGRVAWGLVNGEVCEVEVEVAYTPKKQPVRYTRRPAKRKVYYCPTCPKR